MEFAGSAGAVGSLLLLSWAVLDFDGLRRLLLESEPDVVEKAAAMLLVISVVISMCLRAAAVFLTERADLVLTSPAARAALGPRGTFHCGRDLAGREVTLARSVPNADQRWQLIDLARDISQNVTEGSELLDRRVLQALRIEAPLKPTREADHAMQLLRWRFGGVRSALEWSVEPSRFNPETVIHLNARQGGHDGEWTWVCEAEAATPHLAIVAAAITRETWHWTT